MSGSIPNLFPPPPPLFDLSECPSTFHIGTSSWSSPDWKGTIYSSKARPGDFLEQYSRHLRSVEIDSTFYAIPSDTTVKGWRRKTPDGFTFSAKIPRTITHDGYLEGCDDDFKLFMERMDLLGDRLGPLIFQFPYFARGRDADEWESGDDFRRRLAAFLPKLPAGRRFGVEVRNEKWIGEPLVELLHGHGVALVLLEYYTMPPIQTLLDRLDLLTADFAYVRFLGDHKTMDNIVQGRERPWGSLAVDRTTETAHWIPVVRDFFDKQIDTFVYFNNHFAGHAPGSIRLFLDLLKGTMPTGPVARRDEP